MKVIFGGLFLFVGLAVCAQDYERVDASIELYPKRVNSAEELSHFITRDFQTEEEKVRAIYTWLIKNVIYDPEEYKKFNYSFKNYRERNAKEEKTRAKIIQRTLQKGVAVCEGYAMVFERLCELQGISNYLVRGDTKTHFKDIGRSFDTNHMWNVAVIDGKPYLFDPTWGAGRYAGKFIKDPTYFYYKTDPEQFFKTHYPDIFEDAFVEERVDRQEFANRPLIISKELLFTNIESPRSGIVNTRDYFDEILFSINGVSPETVGYSYGMEEVAIEKVVQEDGTLKFGVPIELGQRQLLIYLDGKPALGYTLK